MNITIPTWARICYPRDDHTPQWTLLILGQIPEPSKDFIPLWHFKFISFLQRTNYNNLNTIIHHLHSVQKYLGELLETLMKSTLGWGSVCEPNINICTTIQKISAKFPQITFLFLVLLVVFYYWRIKKMFSFCPPLLSFLSLFF